MNLCTSLYIQDADPVAAVLSKLDLGAILVTDPYNFRYLSGFGGEGMLFISKEKKYLLTDSRYTIAAKEASGPRGFRVIEYGRNKPLIRWIRDMAMAEQIKRIGFEDLEMTAFQHDFFSKRLSILEFVPLGDALNALRMVKTPQEIEMMRKAEAIGDKAFEAVLPLIKEGMTELQLAAEIEYAMKKNGAQGFSFDTIVASGLNSAKPHHVPTDKKIEQGDFITMDFGCIYEGYCSDMTRTVVLGKASEQQKEIYQLVLAAQLAALDVIKAGMTGAQVDAAARDLITQAGHGAHFGHGLGHSVGLYIHESPNLSPAEQRVLVPGNIETVEPGVYIEGFGGVRIEDMVVVTENGCENLTHSPKQLIEI